MKLLLTYHSEEAEKFGQSCLDWCNGYDEGAKAQLKKVAEWIKALPTDGHDKWYWYHQDLAQAILKEVKE